MDVGHSLNPAIDIGQVSAVMGEEVTMTEVLSEFL